MYDPQGNVACKLTDHAAQLAVADRMAAGIGKPCTVKDRRYVGLSQQHEILFEVACQEGKGYILIEAANGSLSKSVDCVNSDLCTLTDARTAKTEQAGLYTRLSRKAGFDCDVKSYAPFPASSAAVDAVELTCNNRQDGGVGVFTATGGSVYDCAHAELEGYRCSMTKPELSYPTLTADLKKMGKSECAVSNARSVGVTAEKHGFIEVACADGLQGYMIEYTVTPLAPVNTIICAQAGGIANGCKLPGNVKKG
jgi:hypothetical protein